MITVLLMPALFSILPVGREVLEAIVALIAVAVLFYVSFWLIARIEHNRWMEFVRARLWSAISVGSTASLVAVGFTAVYREGFETALFYQSLLSFGEGLGAYILLGIGLALVALAGVAVAVFRLGRKLPVRTFMNIAVAMVMATSVAFLGNAVKTLQAADVITYRRTERAAPADLPGRGHGRLADRAVARRPDHAVLDLRLRRAVRLRRASPPRQPTAGTESSRRAGRDMTRVRVGVDVGGTFTKAVAVELTGRSIVASVVVPTTHTAEGGVAAGVVARGRRARRPGRRRTASSSSPTRPRRPSTRCSRATPPRWA